MARNVYGLDLGTYDIKIYDKKSNEIYTVKDTIAIKDKTHILEIGNKAYEMFEKTPPNIEVVFPMKEGVISRFNDIQFLLNNILKGNKQLVSGSEYVIAVPTDVTEVEKKAFYDLLLHSKARARSVRVVDRGIADAVGLGLDIENEKAIFIANLGAETMEISVISYGGIVLNKLVKKGARDLDQSIQTLIRNKYDFLIGSTTAELLRKSLGFFSVTEITSKVVPGRNMVLGVPQQKEIKINVVRAALKEPLNELVKEIRAMLERTPPDILREIQKNGIYLVGGLSNLNGLDYYLSQILEIPVYTTDKPEHNSITGISKIINSNALLKLTYSMSEGKYRWMR